MDAPGTGGETVIHDVDQLARLGWDENFAAAFDAIAEPDLQPARVGIEHNHLYRVYAARSEPLASVAGRLRYTAAGAEALPAVGDWVAIRPSAEGPAQIRALLPRRTCFSRKSAGDTTTQQVVAANIDTVFLVSGLDGDFNLRRIERYLVATTQSGATPVIVLNKADLAKDAEGAVRAVRERAPNVPIHTTSCAHANGFEPLLRYLSGGRTVALLGSSGVGKSSIINRLLGYDRQTTRTVRRQDSRGRHTTVHRELLLHPHDGVIIDTPGMRELRLWDTEDALETMFNDIDALAAGCRFRDCRHRGEPGCAVGQAVSDGTLTVDRLAHYHKLVDERTGLELRRDELAQLKDKTRAKSVPRTYRRVFKR